MSGIAAAGLLHGENKNFSREAALLFLTLIPVNGILKMKL
jgi:hypothetical protein